MSDASLEFASLLCSRLCEDLLNPIGTIAKGIELLAANEDPEVRRQCLELLVESAHVSAGKLAFFRLAYGAATDGDVASRDARSALEGVLGGSVGPLALGWHVAEPTLSSRAAKILLNLGSIAGEALVQGGRLDVGAERDEIVVRAEGPRVVIDPAIIATLTGTPAAADARTAAAWLVRRLAEDQGGQIQIVEEEGVVLFGAALFGPTVDAIVA